MNVCLIPKIQYLSFPNALQPSVSGVFDYFKSIWIVDCGWHLVILLIRDCSDSTSQDLTTSCLGQLLHEDDSFKPAESTNILSNLLLDIFGHLGLLVICQISFTLEDNVSQWDLSSHLLIESNNCALDNALVLIDDFLESTCRDSVTSGVDDIVCSSHDV